MYSPLEELSNRDYHIEKWRLQLPYPAPPPCSHSCISKNVPQTMCCHPLSWSVRHRLLCRSALALAENAILSPMSNFHDELCNMLLIFAAVAFPSCSSTDRFCQPQGCLCFKNPPSGLSVFPKGFGWFQSAVEESLLLTIKATQKKTPKRWALMRRKNRTFLQFETLSVDYMDCKLIIDTSL